MPMTSIAMIAAALAGLSDITVQPSRANRNPSAYQRSIVSLDRPSERTIETLRRYSQETRYRDDPEGALAFLERAARKDPEPELVYALAELSWVEGQLIEGHKTNWRHRRKATALDRYVDAVAYAFDFLFDPELEAGRQPSDPRFRQACELYNGGLERLIRAAEVNGKIQPGDTIPLKIHGREQDLKFTLEGSPWTADDVDEMFLAIDYEVTGGLDTRSHQFGLGVPLIAVRRSDAHDRDKERFYPPEMAFPLTVFLQPDSKLRDAPDDARDCTLKLIDPVKVPSVPIKLPTDKQAPSRFPVETDLTIPIAYMWSRTDLSQYRWKGLLRPGSASDRAGLMLLRPYEPDKIPVVMVHGLISSPLAWIPMLNELLRDPEIQKRYQFMLYLYPTGVPVPIAAAGLREALGEAQKTFNPDGRNPAFNQMVLLGHSMGGLLSHAMVVDSDNRFWELNSDRPFDEIEGPPDVLAELKRYMFFKAQPFVTRVVFLATPHRGSDLSKGVVGRVSSGLIAEPDHISGLLRHLIRANPDAFNNREFRRMPTSIDTLDPNSPVLMALMAMAPNKAVKFNSIIGAERPGPVASTTDGVVPYRSSHFEGAESELRVRSGHGVQENHDAIREVRRILLEHLAKVPAGTFPVAATVR